MAAPVPLGVAGWSTSWNRSRCLLQPRAIQALHSFPASPRQPRRLRMPPPPLGATRRTSRPLRRQEGRTSTLCTTTVDGLRSQYIPKRVQKSLSFRHDTPPVAPPVTRRRGGKVRQRGRPTEGGSPVPYLEKLGGPALLHDGTNGWSSSLESMCQISNSTFQLIPPFFFNYSFWVQSKLHLLLLISCTSQSCVHLGPRSFLSFSCESIVILFVRFNARLCVPSG